MLTIDRLHDIRTGHPLNGYFIRNGQGKIIATGATGHFVQIRHKRYENDTDLVSKVERLAGMPTRR